MRHAIAPRALENDARLLHGSGNDGWVVAFLCRALVEEILVGAQASNAAFIDGAAIARSKKPREVWKVFSFLAMDVYLRGANPQSKPAG